MKVRVDLFDDEDIKKAVIALVRSYLDGGVMDTLRDMTKFAVERRVSGSSTPIIEKVVAQEVGKYMRSAQFTDIVRGVVAEQVTARMADALAEVSKRPRQ